MFGHRKDGRKVKKLHGTTNILIDFKPERSLGELYINDLIDVTDFVKYIDSLKKKNDSITYFHGMAFIMAKVLYNKPYMNRFIANRTLYEHNDVSLSFVAKAEFADESVEYLTVLKVGYNDKIEDISKVIKEKVDKIRNHQNDGTANDAADKIGHLPKYIRIIVTGVLKWMDKHGCLPASVTDGNIYYSSAIISNIGTFKVGGIYHNLADFGTSSSLITFGEIKEKDGRKYMELGATIDERIADGFYFCKALKLIEYLFENPSELDKCAGDKIDGH